MKAQTENQPKRFVNRESAEEIRTSSEYCTKEARIQQTNKENTALMRGTLIGIAGGFQTLIRELQRRQKKKRGTRSFKT